MAEVIYCLCALISAACAYTLYRGYSKTANRLLLWSAFCFSFIAFGNGFLCVDLIAFPNTDLHGPLFRNLMSASAGGLLLSGLILELS